MAVRVTFRAEAEADLESIYDFIAENSPHQAFTVIQRLREHCRTLSEFPERGVQRHEYGNGIRILPADKATIVYVILPDRVQIVRVFYRGRDIEAVFRDD